MKKFNLIKSLTRVINNRKGLLILCLSLATFGIENVWGNSASISGETFKSATSWSGSHTSFSLEGSNDGYNRTLKALNIKKNTPYTIKWTVNSGCTINVTKVSVEAGSAKLSCKIQVSGGSEANIALKTATSTANNLSLGNDQSITFSATNTAYVYSISITYTITPDAPSITNNTATIDVTTDTNNKQVVEYVSRFSVTDNDFVKIYTKTGGEFDGNNFYATSEGTYTITSSIKAKDGCHNASAESAPLTIIVNRLNPTLTYNNANLDISISDADKTTIDLYSLKTAYTGNGTISYNIKSGNGAHLSGSTLYATTLGSIVITATASQTEQYNSISTDFTINVVRRTPTISWKTFEHIYAGYILDDVASTSYNDKPVTLDKTYESLSPVISIDTEDKTKLHISSTITKEQEAEVKVITTETPYYKSVEGTHTYTLEPKATPVFKLNGDTLSTETTTNLYLEIGDTANVSFELTDESQFEYPQTTANNYFSYEHDAVNHTGVITATKFGNETFAFHQKGTATIFDHTCNLHIYVSKHQSSLSTPLVDGTWKVDSLYTGSLYSSNDPNEVIVSSSNDKVLKLTDEGLKAVGAGTAILYICQAATDDWTGDTISVNINVEKYTPEFTWNIDANCGWNTVFENPFSSNNTTPECSFICTSSAPSIANYVDGRIYIFNKDGDVTFTLKQLGNYCWNEKTTEYQINVKKKENHLPIYLNSAATRDAVYSGKSSKGSVSCDNSGKITLDQNGGLAVWTANPLYYTIQFTGIPNKLSFTYSQSMASSTAIGDTKKSFIVYQSADGSNWVELWTSNGAAGNTSDHNVSSLALLRNTRFIKFFFDGTYAGYYKNIQVTERKEIVAPASCDFGAANVGADASKKTISVDWYNVQTCTLTITGTNADLFAVNPSTIASSLDNYGTADIEVSYLHTVGGSHSATLTIQSADGKSATINLSGTSNKITPTITWKENLSPMEKGSSIENPAQAAGLTFSYESSDPTVIEIINGNTLHALKKGFADITATFDGTNDVTWNSASDKTTVEVTDIKVLRIDWPQSFTNLKTDKPDITIKAEVYYYNFDDSTTVAIDRPITFTSQNTNVVTIVNGAVHIVGKGETTITATVEDVENEYIGTTVIRKVRVREPSEGCDIYVLENASGSLFTEITSFSGVEKELVLSGEPGSITFDAWSEKWYAINPSGNLKVAEYYNGSYHTIWDQTLNVGNETSYGPIALNRKTTKIKFFKEVGSTCYHNFASAYVTLAKYLELDNTAGKTTMTVDFPESETSTDVTYTKYVDVNFSNITDVLDVDIEKGTNFKVLKQDLSSKIEEIGTDCGDKGKVTIAIQFLANEVKNYSDKITISNKDQSVTINLTAEVARHDQQITWNPTTNLLTTDQVSFSATTTATDLNVTYAIKGTSDVASVTSDGILTIYKFGEVTIVASQAGSEVYKPAVDVERTFTISRVTPTITTLPIAAEVILPKTLANCTLTGGEASVEGVFTWTNSTTNIERGNTGYEVTFTPSNLNYYTTTTCIVVVPVAKDPQTITWNFTETTMFCNADITFNATASSGLKVKYATSDASIAYVDNANHLNIIKGGEVTITAQQEGDITWAVAPEVSKVLTINRFTPTIVEIPTASPMLIGQLISNSVLTGGRAELNNVFVPGTYAWENSNTATIDVAGKTTHIVIFSPQNSNYYNSTTCEVEVEVKKYAPTITNNLSATAITYGQALSASVLNGTLTAMDNVKYPSVEVEGTYTWKEPATQLEAGNHSEVVRFTPANLDWYDVVDVEVPVVVNKAHATTATAVVNMLYGQILDEVQPINTTTDAITGIVEGTITWGTGVDVEAMPNMGVYDYPIRLAVTDPNYVAETIDGTCHVTVEKGFVFDGHGGSTEWNTADNWVEGTKPTTMEDKVIVTANALIVNTEVNVGAITIKQGVDVTIEENGVLNVGDYDCVSRKEYGNMIIKQGGQLNLNEGEVQVKDFTLEAALGGIKDDARVDARSGQVTNASQLVVNGNAYFEIALDASGECTQGWYDFTVPFPVNAISGVQRYENGVLRTNLKNEVNYAIMSYHEDVRAQGKYGWSKYRGIMQPGQCYSITIDNYYNVYRFVKTTDGALNTSNEVQITATEGGEEVNKGWNGIGNGTLSYANITASDIDKVQVYDHATNSYSPVEISNTTFVVGSSFFVQTPQTESVIYNKATSIGQLYAPKQTSQVSEEFMVTLSNTRTQNEVDRLYLSASEDAIDSYEIGHDLAKFDVSSSVAQMWCSAYDMRLCDVELPLEYETALFPISFSAPTQGQYTLSVAKKGSNDHLYLLYQGYRVADLTMGDYALELYKGTDTNYALQLVSTYHVPTEMENNEQENIVRKVIIDNQLYIFYDKKVYDITGKIIK